MKFLVDEQISRAAAEGLDAFDRASDDEWRHIVDVGAQGMADEDIPSLCKREGYSVLVSLNYADFGARKHYFAGLLANEISVVVIRPKKQQLDAGQQMGLIAMHLVTIKKHLVAASSPILIRCTHSAVTARDLAELITEISG